MYIIRILCMWWHSIEADTQPRLGTGRCILVKLSLSLTHSLSLSLVSLPYLFHPLLCTLHAHARGRSLDAIKKKEGGGGVIAPLAAARCANWHELPGGIWADPVKASFFLPLGVQCCCSCTFFSFLFFFSSAEPCGFEGSAADSLLQDAATCLTFVQKRDREKKGLRVLAPRRAA